MPLATSSMGLQLTESIMVLRPLVLVGIAYAAASGMLGGDDCDTDDASSESSDSEDSSRSESPRMRKNLRQANRALRRQLAPDHDDECDSDFSDTEMPPLVPISFNFRQELTRTAEDGIDYDFSDSELPPLLPANLGDMVNNVGIDIRVTSPTPVASPENYGLRVGNAFFHATDDISPYIGFPSPQLLEAVAATPVPSPCTFSSTSSYSAELIDDTNDANSWFRRDIIIPQAGEMLEEEDGTPMHPVDPSAPRSKAASTISKLRARLTTRRLKRRSHTSDQTVIVVSPPASVSENVVNDRASSLRPAKKLRLREALRERFTPSLRPSAN